MMIPVVSQVMSTHPWTIERHATLTDAHRIMRGHHVRHLPVIDDRGICGIVTERDTTTAPGGLWLSAGSFVTVRTNSRVESVAEWLE